MSTPPNRNGSLNMRLAAAYRQACMRELDALKPGNVHRYSDGHRMTLEDFITSADVSAGPLTTSGIGLGERIFRGVEATRKAVGCNTNLGILMLCAPLIQALLDEHIERQIPLRDRLHRVLSQADESDTQWLFRAIALAAPGGLGTSEKYDIRDAARVPLLEVMQHASERDQIARQYITDFTDLYDYALPCLRACELHRNWVMTELYLNLLARFPDTHIRRKHGFNKALEVSLHAAELAKGLSQADKPEHYLLRLLQADTEFKREGINPGTTADMTVATLFISYLESMLPAFEQKTGFSRVRDSRPQEAGVRS